MKQYCECPFGLCLQIYNIILKKQKLFSKNQIKIIIPTIKRYGIF